MKTILRLSVTFMLATLALIVQSQTLEDNLASVFAQFDTSKTLPEMMSVSSRFDLIAMQYNTEWASNYYAAYAKAIISFQETDVKKKDLLIDEAEKYFTKVKTVLPDSSEKYVLAALILNARISVDGRSRGQTYGEAFNQDLIKAKAINPNNPRIYYLKGSSLFYTPKLFGGGKNKAKDYFDRATPLFAAESKNTILKPYWGEKQNQSYIDQCKGN